MSIEFIILPDVLFVQPLCICVPIKQKRTNKAKLFQWYTNKTICATDLKVISAVRNVWQIIVKRGIK